MVEIKYSGYIDKQKREVAKNKKQNLKEIPRDIEYSSIAGLSNEVKEKLISSLPTTIGSVPQNEQDRSLVMAPMFHAAGSNGILAAIWQGALQVPLGTFDPAAVLDLIEKHRINITLGVPSMFSFHLISCSFETKQKRRLKK